MRSPPTGRAPDLQQLWDDAEIWQNREFIRRSRESIQSENGPSLIASIGYWRAEACSGASGRRRSSIRLSASEASASSHPASQDE
jgi:hypothetical protein